MTSGTCQFDAIGELTDNMADLFNKRFKKRFAPSSDIRTKGEKDMFGKAKEKTQKDIESQVESGEMGPGAATAISVLTDFFMPESAGDVALSAVPGGRGLSKLGKGKKKLSPGEKAKRTEEAHEKLAQARKAEEAARKKAKQDLDDSYTLKYSQKEGGGQDFLKDPKLIKPKKKEKIGRTTEEYWESLKKNKPE